MSTNANLYLVLAVLSFVSLGFFAAAFLIFLKRQTFLRRAVRAAGVVTRLSSAKNSDGGATYVPVATFTTAGGARHEVSGTIGSNPPAYRVGDRVTIAYLPKRPREARFLSFFELYWLPALFAVFGAATGGAAILVKLTGLD